MVGDHTYLTVAEVCARLREAGYDDSPQTVRRLLTAGHLTGRRTEIGGHRRIEAASVDALIAKRRAESEPLGNVDADASDPESPSDTPTEPIV
jgi:excisionase family DNA binding protein